MDAGFASRVTPPRGAIAWRWWRRQPRPQCAACSPPPSPTVSLSLRRPPLVARHDLARGGGTGRRARGGWEGRRRGGVTGWAAGGDGWDQSRRGGGGGGGRELPQPPPRAVPARRLPRRGRWRRAPRLYAAARLGLAVAAAGGGDQRRCPRLHDWPCDSRPGRWRASPRCCALTVPAVAQSLRPTRASPPPSPADPRTSHLSHLLGGSRSRRRPQSCCWCCERHGAPLLCGA